MFTNTQHLKLLLLLLLCSQALGLGQEELQPLHRSKRTLTTICVEIQPSGPQNEPYFMCKGADFSNGAPPAASPVAAPVAVPTPTPQAAQDQQQQNVYNYPQPAAQSQQLVPFPSFPSFDAGFFPASQSYENAYTPKATPTSPAAQSYGSAGAAPFAPASAPQSYGLPAVFNPAAGGTAATPHGTLPGPSAATTPTAYADAGTKKQGQASNGNGYETLADSRHRIALDDSVLAVPNVGFQPEELNPQYRRPIDTMLLQLQQPAAMPHPYYDDPIMRTFYASLGQQEPQVAQAAPMPQGANTEPLVAQVMPAAGQAYPTNYGEQQQQPPAPIAPPTPPAAPPAPPQPIYNANPAPIASSSTLDGNACTSCNRPCSATAENCPSYQPVIIAMPCYGQQQPTHYLAVPGTSAPSGRPLAREPVVGGPFATSFGLAPQVGTPFGYGSQTGPAYAMTTPQFGAMGPQVGAPFGMAPMLNPFGPFGALNPFNPFNRILGAPAQNTPMPRMRLFGAPDGYSTPTTTAPMSSPIAPQFQQQPQQQPTANSFKLNFFSSTLAPPTRLSTEAADNSAPAVPDEDEEDDDGVAEEEGDASLGATPQPQDAETTADDKSGEDDDDSKEPTIDELVKKGEEKIKNDKRKRQNSRFSNNKTQKRKYLQRL